MTTAIFVPGGYDKTQSVTLALAGQAPTMEALLSFLDDARLSHTALGALVRVWHHRSGITVSSAVHVELLGLGLVDAAGVVALSPPSSVLPAPRGAESIVYYLRRQDGPIKIGFSKDLSSRVSDLEKLHGPLTVLATEPGSRATETRRHRQFRALQITDAPAWQGPEWFRPGAALLAHIESIGASR